MSETGKKTPKKTPKKESLKMKFDLRKMRKRVASGTPTKADKATKKLIMEKIDYEGDDSEGNDSEPGNDVESMEEEETSDLSTIVRQVVENVGIGNSSKASSHNQLVKAAEKAILNLLPTIVQAIAVAIGEKMEERFSAMEERIEKLEHELKMEKETVMKVKTKLSDTTESNLREMELRETKKLNIMLFNVEESTAGSEEEQLREDAETLVKIQRDMGTSVPLTNVIRIGKAGVNKVRPLRATAPDSDSHRELLISAKKLRNSTVFNKVFLNRDMTPLERIQWKSLIKERKEKQEESKTKGENVKWVIHRGKVVPGN